MLELTVPAPDTDFLAHEMWARQILRSGSATISTDGRWDDSAVYYPNTVPKPAELLQLLAGELAGGSGAHAAIRVALAFTATAMAALSAFRASRSRGTAAFAGFVFGLNPAFISMSIGGSPAIPFLALLLPLSLPATLAAGFVRPEALIYAAADAVGRRKWLLLPALLPIAAAWLLLNHWMAATPFWSGFEVAYVVKAMPYETPGPIQFWPWAAGRALLVMGPVFLGALLLHPRSWPRLAGGLGHLAFLSLTLLMGSLALPRYVDQVFLLALPWAVVAASSLPLPARVPRGLAATVAFAGAMALWPPAIQSMVAENRIARELDRVGEEGWTGRLAVNELLVPRVALSAGIDDPRRAFVALDRMIYEDRDPGSLGVGTILVVPGTAYLPQRTASWVENHPGPAVDTLEVPR